MAETISMPKLGFDMAEGVLVRWVKQVAKPSTKAMCWPRSKPTKPPLKLNLRRAAWSCN